MKTIEQHLQELPEPVRDQALKNMWWEDKHNKYATQVQALQQAFNWSKSPEGYWYWYNVETDLVWQLMDISEENFKKIRKQPPQRP